jgi:cysteinyl-tRNA synthetase
MNLKEFGEQIDIHGGGNDLIFPHHENEIAQSESFTGKPFARFWIHNGMLQLSGEKMSKSLGNIVSIKEFLEKRSADTLRMMVLSGSYRAPLIFGEEVLDAAERAVDRLKSAFRPGEPDAPGIPEGAAAELDSQAEATRVSFIEAMEDDFNTPVALAAIHELVKAINSAKNEGARGGQLQPAQAVLHELAGVLGLGLTETGGSTESGKFIELLLTVRSEARKQKLYAFSDLIRDGLSELGVQIEDGKSGTTWRWA